MTADGIAWERTKWWQLQSELTFDRRLSERAKVRFFANGGWQLLYKPNNDTDRANVYGVGYGGRLELGPVQVKIRKFDVSRAGGSRACSCSTKTSSRTR